MRHFPSVTFLNHTLYLKTTLPIDKTNSLIVSPNNKQRSWLNISNTNKQGYLLEILFHSLNFHTKRIKLRRPRYFIDLHKSELLICNEKSANLFKSRVYKRRLIFFSFNKHLINSLERKIKEFKLPDAYTGKGLFSRTDPYIKKRGKIRKK
jgi:hypothetical protein